MKKILWLLIIVAMVCVFWWLAKNYFLLGQESSLRPGEVVLVSQPQTTTDSLNAGPNAATNSATTLVPYQIEVFASNLNVPWSLVFTSPDRALVAERPGRIRVINDGELTAQPLRTFPEVSTDAEEGLMGMTLDPDYTTNRYLYICLAYEKNGQTVDKVIRLKDQGDSLTDDTIILDDIPAARFHAGCRLRFGPDSKLYISTGDATDKQSAQDLTSLGGKILRLDPDGSIPADNPFPNSPIYSYGHRNPQGFDWHPVSGILVATEHGPSGIDGPGGGDEVNLIQKGQNYGWPLVSHTKSRAGLIDPLLVFTPAVAPASGMFYRGSVFPQFTNTFLFGILRGEGIIQVTFDPQQPTKVLSYQKLADIQVGRIRDVAEGPDGLIYFTTSNQDGRGKPQAGDDRIYRLVPKP